MLNLVAIFTTGGVILFYRALDTLKFDILDALIQNQLSKDKSDQSYYQDPYRVAWLRSTDQRIIFLIAFQEHLQIEYPDYLLRKLQKTFTAKMLPQLVQEHGLYTKIPSFDLHFEHVVKKWQAHSDKMESNKGMKNFYETKKGKELLRTTQKNDQRAAEASAKQLSQQPVVVQKTPQENGDKKSIVGTGTGTSSGEEKGEDGTADDSNQNSGLSEQEQLKLRRAELAKKFLASPGKNSAQKKVETKAPNEEGKKKKQMAVAIGKVNKGAMDALDFSKEKGEISVEEAKRLYLYTDASQNIGKDQGFFSDDDVSSDSSDEEHNGKNASQTGQSSKTGNASSAKRGFFAKITNSFKTFAGQKSYDEQDLEPVLAKFKEQLMSKNVAEEIAQKLYGDVQANLLKQKAVAFTSITQIVKKSLSDSITKILTPKRIINPIAEALTARQNGRPYVIAFIGVNGVGKSTNLAKVAYLFKNEGFSVMLAACDNFRAGAVEQLKTHGRCLDVPVFDRGYKSEPPDIAFEAIKEAAYRKIDVVLIDTAGRMQDNEPLMRSLARLVKENKPDLIIFIGEALVGNDGIDQLVKFNKALIDLSDRNSIREIDAIILSKFDTVDDKVGAAISMTYATGKPILFVGVGQKYTHLKKLNVKTVVHALLA